MSPDCRKSFRLCRQSIPGFRLISAVQAILTRSNLITGPLCLLFSYSPTPVLALYFLFRFDTKTNGLNNLAYNQLRVLQKCKLLVDLFSFVFQSKKNEIFIQRRRLKIIFSRTLIKLTRGQSNLTKSASRGAHSPVRGHPRGSKFVPLNSWGRGSY